MKTGGRRPGAGRKKIDKRLIKKRVEIYTEQWRIDKLGGIEKAKEYLHSLMPQEIDEPEK